MDYARQSFGALDEALVAIDAARFGELRSSGYAIHAGATALSDYYFLALTHTNGNLGEMEYVRTTRTARHNDALEIDPPALRAPIRPGDLCGPLTRIGG